MEVSQKALDANRSFNEKLDKLMMDHIELWSEDIPMEQLIPSMGANCMMMAVALPAKAGVPEEAIRANSQECVDTFFETQKMRGG